MSKAFRTFRVCRAISGLTSEESVPVPDFSRDLVFFYKPALIQFLVQISLVLHSRTKQKPVIRDRHSLSSKEKVNARPDNVAEKKGHNQTCCNEDEHWQTGSRPYVVLDFSCLNSFRQSFDHSVSAFVFG